MMEDLTENFIGELSSLPPEKNYETNKTMIKSVDDTWSSELLDMNDYGPKKTTVIDIF